MRFVLDSAIENPVKLSRDFPTNSAPLCSLSPREGRAGRESERGASDETNLLSPTLSSFARGEGEASGIVATGCRRNFKYLCLVLLVNELIFSGCASRKLLNSETDRFQSKQANTVESKSEASSSRNSKSERAAKKPKPNEVVTHIELLSGKVASANANLRFVVLDFSLQPLPAIEQRLNVYRNGRKVGEVKVSGPARDSNIVADVIAGEVQVGDEVRED